MAPPRGTGTAVMRMLWWNFQLLKSRKAETRRSAVERLSEALTWEVLEQLLPLTQDPDAGVKKAVFLAVEKLPDPRATPFVAQAMRDPAPEIREHAATTLGILGDGRARDGLLSGLRDGNAAVRRQCARGLEQLGFVPESEAQQVDYWVAAGAFGVAARFGAAAVEPLAAVLRDASAPNRRLVVEALSQIADARVIRVIASALKDVDPNVRVAAVEALSSAQDPKAVEGLCMAVKDREAPVRAAAADALGRSGSAAGGAALTPLLRDARWDVRKAAVEALGRLQHKAAVEAVAELLQDPDHDVREAAARSLGEIRDEAAVSALILALTDPQTAVRQLASSALVRINRHWEKTEGARAAIPALRMALKHREYWVRQSAAETLAKITDIRSVTPGVTGMTDPASYRKKVALGVLMETLRDYDRDFRVAAAEALGRIGDVQAREALTEALSDADEWVRRAAGAAVAEAGWGEVWTDGAAGTAAGPR